MRYENFMRALAAQGLITEQDAEVLRGYPEDGAFLAALVEKYVSFDKLLVCLSDVYKIESVELSETKISPEATQLLPHSGAVKHVAMPLRIQNDSVEIAISDPFDWDALDDLRLITGHQVIAKFALPWEIRFFINKFYGSENIYSITTKFMDDLDVSDMQDEKLELEIQNAPAVRLIDSLIESAVFNNASDIHIEPFENHIRTRYRIDGHLEELQRVDKSLLPFIISRLKVMGNMDISEKRLPQDGRFRIDNLNMKIDFRLSTIPTIHGEKAVLRLIYRNDRILSKESLGFSDGDLEKISTLFRSTHGAILITGPTGSGKTTTLSTFIQELNSKNVNIVTIEDPVEISITGVNQMSISPKAGLDFAEALRAILRQDPDIIMIGEIRDRKTADIAMRAAMTGHLVLTTLHTNDAISAIIRLVEMGVPEYIVVSTVRGVISQRLVRKICPHCKVGAKILPGDAKTLRAPVNTTVYSGRGCPKCDELGYKGRFAVYEYIIMDYELTDAVKSGASAGRLHDIMVRKGMKTIFENARDKVLNGETTIEEMYRAVFDARLLAES